MRHRRCVTMSHAIPCWLGHATCDGCSCHAWPKKEEEKDEEEEEEEPRRAEVLCTCFLMVVCTLTFLAVLVSHTNILSRKILLMTPG